jgi:hypothetical protein
VLPNFEKAIEAFAEATIHRRRSNSAADLGSVKQVSQFLASVHARMPDFLRLPFRVLILAFDAWSYLSSGRPFHQLELPRRILQIERWEQSRLEVMRRTMEFYGSLALFGLYSELYGNDYSYQVESENSKFG